MILIDLPNLASRLPSAGSGSSGLAWPSKEIHMNPQKQIKEYIAAHPEPKRSEMQQLNGMISALMPSSILWFLDRAGVAHVLKWFVLLAVVVGSTAVAETLNGFITDRGMAGQFTVGAIRVTVTRRAECELGSIYGIKVVPSISARMPPAIYMLRRRGLLRVGPIKTVSMPCGRVTLAVGQRVHLTGIQVRPGAFVASRITVYSIKQPNILSGTALIEDDSGECYSRVSKTPVWIDGYKIEITPATRVQVASERHQSINCPIRANTWVTYKATRVSDQSLMAESLVISTTTADSAGSAIFKAFNSNENSSNCVARSDNPDHSIQFSHGDPIQVVRGQSVQKFVSSIGAGLVPDYQSKLFSNATKVRFHFCVVRSDQLASHRIFQRIDGVLPHQDPELGYDATHASIDQRMNDIVAFPNGLILVPDSALTHLHNTAQLGALLSYGITAIMQKDVDRARAVEQSGSIQDAKDRFRVLMDINRQVLRLGIRQLYLAGYDIREAPWAWTVAQGKPANNAVFRGSSTVVRPWYAAYAFKYISDYYSSADYSKLKRGETEYAEFLKELQKADPEAFAKKK